MEEKWNIIEEFPSYKVSNYGDILNTSTGKLMKQSVNTSGVLKVGLVMGGKQYARSVKILVADAFVFGRSDIFDTPIHLDGNPHNNRADNLAWRPRWFAWKYTRQFAETYNHHRGPVRDVSTDIWYNTVIEAATANGILVKDIIRSVGALGFEIFPTGQKFSFR